MPVRARRLACAVALLPSLVSAGSVWTELAPPSAAVLHAVRFVNRVAGWAAGAGGTIERFDHGSWQNAPSGTDEDLDGLAVLGTDEAWAVGNNGTILHYLNGGWGSHAQSKAVTLVPLHAIAFLNPDNGWAVGGSPAQGGVILHYDGAAWVSATTTSDPLYDLALVASDFIWFCGGNRRLVKFDGTAFTTQVSPVVDGLAWRTIAFPFRSVGWVAGDGGKIAESLSGAWGLHAQGSALTAGQLLGMSFLPADGSGYLVGSGGLRLAYRGGLFTAEASGGGDLMGIHLVNELEGGAVGGSGRGRILARRAVTEESLLDHVRVWPRPFDPGRGQSVTLDRLPANVTRLDIFTLTGDRIAGLGEGVRYDAATGVATWDGHSRLNRPVAAGTYPYRVETGGGGGVAVAAKGLILVARR